MLNLVQVMGYLGQDPELRYTTSGQACVNLNVATTETWMDNNNQKQSHTEWHRVVVWGKPAENCAQYLTKGRAVHAIGKLRTRSWQDNSGATKYTTEIIAKEVIFLPSGGGNQSNNNPPRPNQGQKQAPRQGQNAHNHSAPNMAVDPSLPPNLDEIPF